MPPGDGAEARTATAGPEEDGRTRDRAAMMDEAAPRDSRARKWLDRLQASRHTYALLFTASFLETIIVPIPIEVILIPYMLANRDRIWRISTVVLLGCLVGAAVGYGVGYFVFDTVGRWVMETMGWQSGFEQFQQMFSQYGFWAIIMIGVLPIPFQVAMLAAGAAGYSIPLFILAAVVARGVRYYGLGFLVKKFGARAMALWRRHKITGSIVLAAVFAALWGVMQLVGGLTGGGGSGGGA